MCGLTGLLERGVPARDLEPRLQAMAERLAHCGRDGNGISAEEEPEPIGQLWSNHLSGHRDQSQGLWNIPMPQAWRGNSE